MLHSAPLGPRPPPLPLHQGESPQQVWGLSRSHKDTENDRKITNSEGGRRQEVPWALCTAQRAGIHLTGTGRCPPDEWGAGKKCHALFPWDWGIWRSRVINPGSLVLADVYLCYYLSLYSSGSISYPCLKASLAPNALKIRPSPSSPHDLSPAYLTVPTRISHRQSTETHEGSHRWSRRVGDVQLQWMPSSHHNLYELHPLGLLWYTICSTVRGSHGGLGGLARQRQGAPEHPMLV